MTLPAIYAALWHRKLFILVLTAAVAGAALGLSLIQKKEYTASSLVRIEQRVTSANDVFGALQTGERLARTYAQIAQTRGVETRIETALGDTVPPDAIAITASQVANLELLRLSATYTDPVVAAKVANAAPAALAQFVKETGESRDTITTIENAGVPSTPSSPNVPLNVALGLVVGLILAAGLALLFEIFSDRIPSQEELEKLTGHAVIATVPKLDFRAARPVATDARPPKQRAPKVTSEPSAPAPIGSVPKPIDVPAAPAQQAAQVSRTRIRSDRPWRDDG